MHFAEVLHIVGDAPVFTTGLLLAGDRDPVDVRRQLSRWVRAGKVLQVRRGLYSLAPPWRKVVPHPFEVANEIEPGSCVSLQSALAWHGLIPELVPVTTSVTSGRPGARQTPLGQFTFQHLKRDLMFGFAREDLGGGRRAWVAGPEKALLDLIHLVPGADDEAWLVELRLQDLDRLDIGRLKTSAERFGRPKLLRAAARLAGLVHEEVAGR